MRKILALVLAMLLMVLQMAVAPGIAFGEGLGGIQVSQTLSLQNPILNTLDMTEQKVSGEVKYLGQMSGQDVISAVYNSYPEALKDSMLQKTGGQDVVSAVYGLPGSFSLLGPGNKAVDVALRPTFTWSESADVQEYILMLDNDADFSSPLIVENVGNVTSKTLISDLENNKNYYWKVVAKNAAGQKESNSVGRFVTLKANKAYVLLLFTDDFENDTPGQLPAGYTGNTGANTSIETSAEQASSGSKSLKLYDNSSTVQLKAQRNITLMDKIFIEVDMRTNAWLEVTLNNNNTVGPFVQFRSANSLRYVANGATSAELMKYTNNRWYKVGIDFDASKGKYDFYLDGSLFQSEVSGNAAITNVNNIAFRTGTSAVSDTCYVDNLKVYKYMQKCGSFGLQLPLQNSAGVSTAPVLSWDASAEASSYNVIIDDNADFSSPVVDNHVEATSMEVRGLDFNTKYYLKVIAKNAISDTECNEIQSFTTILLEPPGQFTLGTPANKQELVPIEPTLSWNASFNTSQYRLIVYDDADFSSPVFNSTYENTVLSAKINKLDYSRKYYWKVISINPLGETECQESFSFTVEPKFTLTGLSYTDYSGGTISNVAGKHFVRLNMGVRSNIDEPADVSVIYAVYNSGNTLVDMIFIDKTIGASKEDVFEAGISINGSMQGCYIDMLVCESRKREHVLSNVIRFPWQ